MKRCPMQTSFFDANTKYFLDSFGALVRCCHLTNYL